MNPKITEEVVFALADQLAAKGIKPTNVRIREANGNEGSPSTIAPLMRKWRESREAIATNNIPDMPEHLMRSMWIKLVEECQSLFDDERTELIRQRDEAVDQADDVDEAKSEIDRQDVVIDQLRSDNEKLQDRIAEIEQRLEEQRGINQELSSSLQSCRSDLALQTAAKKQALREAERLWSLIKNSGHTQKPDDSPAPQEKPPAPQEKPPAPQETSAEPEPEQHEYTHTCSECSETVSGNRDTVRRFKKDHHIDCPAMVSAEASADDGGTDTAKVDTDTVQTTVPVDPDHIYRLDFASKKYPHWIGVFSPMTVFVHHPRIIDVRGEQMSIHAEDPDLPIGEQVRVSKGSGYDFHAIRSDSLERIKARHRQQQRQQQEEERKNQQIDTTSPRLTRAGIINRIISETGIKAAIEKEKNQYVLIVGKSRFPASRISDLPVDECIKQTKRIYPKPDPVKVGDIFKNAHGETYQVISLTGNVCEMERIDAPEHLTGLTFKARIVDGVPHGMVSKMDL